MAARFWVNGGSNNNWNDPSNWALTSGGAGGQAVPLATDDVTLDNLGNVACVLNGAAVCLSFTVTAGYTATVTFTNTLTVSGSITLGANMSFAGAAGLYAIANGGTLTSNGKVCPQPLFLGSGGLSTLVGDWTNSAVVSLQSVLNKTTAESLYCQAGLTCPNSCSGSATVVLSGTGTFSPPNQSAGQAMSCSLSFNCGGGTITVSNSVKFGAGGAMTIAYVSGTIVWANGALVYVGGSNTTYDNWATATIPGLIITGPVTVNITTSVLTIVGPLQLPPTSTVTFAGTFGWIAGNVNCSATSTHILSLKDGVEYVAVASFAMGGASGMVATITSSHATNQTKLTLKGGCAYDVSWTAITRVDCSNGVVVYAPHAVLTTTLNVTSTAMPLTYSNFYTTLLTWGNGQTSNVLRVKLTSVFGGPLTGLSYNSTGLIISTLANNEAAATLYAQASGKIETIATLGTFATPTATKCRFREVDVINHPGVYELQLDNSRFSVAGATALTIAFNGALFLAQGDCVIELVAYKPQDPSLGLLVGTVKKNTAFPNFAFPMFDSGGLLKTGLSVTASLRLDGGSFAGTSGSVTEIGSSGWYTVNLLAAETNASVIAFSATATGAVPTCNTIITQS